MSYESYKALLMAIGESNRDKNIKHTKNVIKSTFTCSPSYYQVQAYPPSTPSTSTPLDVWITDDSKLKDQKQVIAIPDQTLDNGYLFYWKKVYWLIVNADPELGDIYSRGIAWKCYSSLKWLDESGLTQESPFTYRLDFYRGAGVNDGKVLIVPSERRYIYIQSNIYTSKIKKDIKFIFDDRVWKVTAIDGLITGLIYLELEETEVDPTKDNMELRIADYYSKVSNYIVAISHNDISSIYVGNPYQINVQVTNRGDIVSVPIVFTSSNETIASIDSIGLLTNHKKGEVTITASYENASDAITLNVLEQVVNNYSVDIFGNTDIRYNATLNFSCIFKNNGFVINDTSEYWLTGDDGTSQTNLVSIVSQDNSKNTCSIKAAKVSGYFRLHVKNKNSLISNFKRIQIKSPLEN